MTEMAERYKMAEEIVMKRYATELGPKGQCQKWKITVIAQDRKDGRLDTSVLGLFADDVSREVERLLSIKPIIQELCKKACEPPSVTEKKPAEPEPEPSLPDNSHGIDLDWN